MAGGTLTPHPPPAAHAPAAHPCHSAAALALPHCHGSKVATSDACLPAPGRWLSGGQGSCQGAGGKRRVMWRPRLLRALRQRNALEVDSFRDVFRTYEAVLSRTSASERHAVRMEQERDSLRERNGYLEGELRRVGKGGSSAETLRRMQELEHKNVELQGELTDKLRKEVQGKNKLIKASERVQELEKELRDRVSTSEALRTSLDTRDKEVQDLEARIQALEEEKCALLDEREGLMRQNATLSGRFETLSQEFEQVLSQLKTSKMQMAELLNSSIEVSEKQDRDEKIALKAEELGIPLHDFTSGVGSNPSSSLTVKPPSHVWKQLEAHSASITSCAFETTGKYFATGSSDRTARLWDGETFVSRTVLNASLQGLLKVGFSPNGELLFGCSSDFSIPVWNVSTCRTKHTLTGHTKNVYGAGFSEDSRNLVSGGQDRTIRYWDINRGTCLRTSPCFSSVYDVCVQYTESAFSGHHDGKIRQWDLRSGEMVMDMEDLHTEKVTGLTLFPDSNRMVTCSRDNTLHIVDLRTRRSLFQLSESTYRSGVDWNRPCVSPYGEYVAVGGSQGCVYFFSTKDGSFVSKIQALRRPVACVSWSPTGESVCVVGNEPELVILSDQ